MACRKENGDHILLKMGCWYLKTLKDGKLDDLKSFKNQKLENHLKTGLGNLFFLKSKGKNLRGWHVAQKVAMLKVAMQSMHKWKEMRNNNHEDGDREGAGSIP